MCFFLSSPITNCLANLDPFNVISGHPPKSRCLISGAFADGTNIALLAQPQPGSLPDRQAFDTVKVSAAADKAYTKPASFVSVGKRDRKKSTRLSTFVTF